MKVVPFLWLVMFTLLHISAMGQKVQGYEIFNSKGKKVPFETMAKELSGADIVFFGELHNDPISHWLQYELVNALGKKKKLILGAEMFEADNQQGLSQFIKGTIDEATFKKEVRLWNNYATDYSKLVQYAKENQSEFIATNIPRKYARMVFQKGFSVLDTLSAEDKRWIAPLPVDYDPEVACYRNMLNMDMGGHAPDENFPKAQAIKDATMAHFILSNYEKGSLFIHFNGSYHSDRHEGILWYTKRKAPQFTQKTISTVLQKDVNTLSKEHIGVADFIICVNENMTTTY
jgi:uncharacterized iron-regulated protein